MSELPCDFRLGRRTPEPGSSLLQADGAGKRFPVGAFVSQVESDATILTFLIPAEAAVGNVFGREKLEAAQYRVVFGNLEFPAENCDPHQAGKWPEGRGWRGHGCRDGGSRGSLDG